ncbi:conserved hypothetical protein [sediment metagenome]|uniref:Uncharacterized protein n=1 Tax=sediment metagenome TaxID=749907 RepID=D9PHQ5_9ZZZZ
MCIAIVIYSSSPSYALDVTLAWDANNETDLAGYKIYYKAGASGGQNLANYPGAGATEGDSPIVVPLGSLANAANPEFTVHGLVDNTYYFVATAYNTDGLESGPSNEVYAQGSSTPPTNSAPTLSSLEVNGASGSSTLYTNDPSGQVDIRIVASDDTLVSQYLILDGDSNANGGTFMGIPGGPRQNPIFTVSDFVLNNSDGNHTIYAWVKDDQGLVSSTATKMNVILDRVAPTVAVSYSVTNPYNAGDVVTITANFTDSSPISGTPKISINYAGTGSDISNASMTQVSNKQWKYVTTVPSGNDGTATLTIAAADAAGNAVGSLTGSTFAIDNSGATVVGFPVINYTESSITVTYSESNMQNATLATSYSLDNGLLLSGNGVDTSGTGRVFKLPLNPATLQRYLIYSLQIGSAVKDASGNAVSSRAIRINDDDHDAMADDWEKQWFGNITAKDGTVDSDGDGLFDSSEYNYARSNPAWGSNRWAISPLNQDSDGDGIPDTYEVSFGLNPVSISDRDLDLDGDSWSNYNEYLYGFSANDPNSHPQASIDIVEVVPLDNAGIPPDTSRIPNETAVSVRLESTNGIDISNSQAVSLSITDGEMTYTRNANGLGVVRLVPLETNGNVAHSLWVSYYRTNETNIANVYSYGATVEVTVRAIDVKGFSLEPAFFSFRIESEEAARWAKEKAPMTVVSNDTPMAGKKTITVQGGTLDGASIIYDSSLAQELGFEPEFGPIEEIPQAPGLGVPLNLLPPAVFSNPVTLTIPCPGYKDVNNVSVYYYDGREWWLACDAAGKVTPEGVAWMVPGSRVNHNEDQNSPAYIQIQVHHFSAAAAGESTSARTTVGSNPSVSGSGSGSGCFISTLWD